MALHVKLQLSARRWRAPLWPVVLPLCDWLTGRGGGEDIPPTQLPSFSSFLPFFLFSLFAISCCAVQSDTWIRLSPSALVWHSSSSNFLSVARDFTQSILGFQHFMLCYLLKGKNRDVFSWKTTGSQEDYVVLIFQELPICFSFVCIRIPSLDSVMCDFLGKCFCFWQFSIFSCPRTSTSAAPNRPAASESRRIAIHALKHTHTHMGMLATQMWVWWMTRASEVTRWKSRITQLSHSPQSVPPSNSAAVLGVSFTQVVLAHVKHRGQKMFVGSWFMALTFHL